MRQTLDTLPLSHKRLLAVLVYVLCLAIGLTILVQRAQGRIGPGPLFADTDDAMRMVVVRDLLSGQALTDIVQHRLNAPFGAEIHWSRLVDLPLAGLVWLFERVMEEADALRLAGIVWPLALYAALLATSGALAVRLAGPLALLPALLLPSLSPAVLAEFVPGRVDHHNVQIVLTLLLLYATIEGLRRPVAALAAGVIAATALAVAIEALPMVLAASAAFGLAFVFDPRSARSAGLFGLALALCTGLHLVLALPPERWTEPACDALSFTFLVLAGLIGAGLLVLALCGRRPRAMLWRLGLGALVGGAAAAIAVALFPQCLAGPYGHLDPWLLENWIDSITEAKPWLESLSGLPAYTIAVGIPPILGLLIVLAGPVRRSENRAEWLVLALFLCVATLVMLAQVRGARLAAMPAIPVAAWALVMAGRLVVRRPFVGVPVLFGLCLAFSGVFVSAIVVSLPADFPGQAQASTSRAERALCLRTPAFEALNAMAPTALMAPIDLGSALLLNTPHSVVAAPYHRNEAGVLDTFAFFNRDAATARAILERRGITHVVVCPAMPEMRGRAGYDPGSFVALHRQGLVFDWLERLPGEGPLELYRVR